MNALDEKFLGWWKSDGSPRWDTRSGPTSGYEEAWKAGHNAGVALERERIRALWLLVHEAVDLLTCGGNEQQVQGFVDRADQAMARAALQPAAVDGEGEK